MEHTAAGWYPSPESSSLLQYWDGEMWTDRMRPVPTSPPVDPSPLKFAPESGVVGSAAVRHELGDGEELVAGFEGSTGFRKQIVVATDRRVIWFKRHGLRGRFVATTLPYDKITDIRAEPQHRMMAPNLTITTNDSSHKIYAVPFETIFEFARFVKLRIERGAETHRPPPGSQQGGPTATTAAAENTDDLVARLERLASLHTIGALTDDEFADAKALLLQAANPDPAI